MFKFLYDIIAIKKGHFGCLPVALPGSKTSLAYACNSLASDPSPFRRCSAFLHFHSQSTSIFSGPYERQSGCECLSWTFQILKNRLFSEYITGWAVFSLNMSLNPTLRWPIGTKRNHKTRNTNTRHKTL